MDEQVRQHVAKYCEERGYGTDDATIIEIIQWDSKRIHREEVRQYNWWNEYLYVVEVDGMFIGYIDAEANRDESVYELGYEFDQSSICEMRPVEKVITVFEPVE